MIKVIGVRFRDGGKTYFFDPKDFEINQGENVIVQTTQGLGYANVIQVNKMVAEDSVYLPLQPVVRVATAHDKSIFLKNKEKEASAFELAKKKIMELGLAMRLVSVECSFDDNKILFYFTADGRIDFRELVKLLAVELRARIELRQIGQRDGVKLRGGLSHCGRECCCSTFMTEFQPVSIKMVQEQSSTFNLPKISGLCGRLMCCLKFEQSYYEQAKKTLPKVQSIVSTADGEGKVIELNVISEKVRVLVSNKAGETEIKTYPAVEVKVLREPKGFHQGKKEVKIIDDNVVLEE